MRGVHMHFGNMIASAVLTNHSFGFCYVIKYCKSCRVEGGQSMSTTQIKFWRLLLANELQKARNVKNSIELAKEGLVICNQFYEYTFGKKFRSEQALR
jgi:hypothetical protein